VSTTPELFKEQASKEVRTIQVLRFVAAFAVVCVHSTFYTHERLASDFAIYHEGARGVRLFFVISGMVMILSSERLTKERRGWMVFAAKRVIRILPLYWLIIFFKIMLLLASSGLALHSRLDVAYVIKSLFFIPAYNVDGEIMPLHGVGWTLNFEMFFYTLFALTLFFRVPPVRVLVPILVLLAFCSPFRGENWPVALRFYSSPSVLDFAAGMLIARWYQRGLVLNAKLSWTFVVLGLVGLFAPSPWPVSEFTESLVNTIFSSLAVVGATALDAYLGRRVPRWAIFMGAASYAIYLVHPIAAPVAPAIFFYFGWHFPGLAVLTSIIVASTSGSLVYVFIEKPLGRVLNIWLSRFSFMKSLSHSKVDLSSVAIDRSYDDPEREVAAKHAVP